RATDRGRLPGQPVCIREWSRTPQAARISFGTRGAQPREQATTDITAGSLRRSAPLAPLRTSAISWRRPQASTEDNWSHGAGAPSHRDSPATGTVFRRGAPSWKRGARRPGVLSRLGGEDMLRVPRAREEDEPLRLRRAPILLGHLGDHRLVLAADE